MAGVKGKCGDPRTKAGGARPGAGRPPRHGGPPCPAQIRAQVSQLQKIWKADTSKEKRKAAKDDRKRRKNQEKHKQLAMAYRCTKCSLAFCPLYRNRLGPKPYCSPCAIERDKERRAEIWKLENWLGKNSVSQRSLARRAKNKLSRAAKARELISASYAATLLGGNLSTIPAELIEMKKEQLEILRLARQLKRATTGPTGETI